MTKATKNTVKSSNKAAGYAIEDGMLVIRLPLTKPTPSATGKTLSVASTHGNKSTDVEIDGQAVIVGVNAYIYANPR